MPLELNLATHVRAHAARAAPCAERRCGSGGEVKLEVIPAILAYTRQELIERIALVQPHVRTVHIDVMDGVFVPNKTVSELSPLPEGLAYEIHWMVSNPEEWLPKAPKNTLHLVHVETITNNAGWDRLVMAANGVSGRLALAFNPDTPLERVLPYVGRVNRFLAMTVCPGFSGQKYITAVEEKIKKLRMLAPHAEIEVDGGISGSTAQSAVNAGANVLAAASAIFSASDIGKAISSLSSFHTSNSPYKSKTQNTKPETGNITPDTRNRELKTGTGCLLAGAADG